MAQVPIPVQGIFVQIDPAAAGLKGDPGPPGPAGGSVRRVSHSAKAGNSAPATASGTELFAGDPVQVADPVAGGMLHVSVTADIAMWRSAESIAGDVVLEERVDLGSGWGAWVAVATMRGFASPLLAGNTSIDVRGSRSCQYSRPVAGIAQCQYRLVTANLSTSPVTSMILYSGAAIRAMEAVA